MIKLLLNKQTFASSDAKFCRETRNNDRYTQNFVCMYVSMKPRGGGLEGPQGGTPPIHEKTSMSKIDL